MYRCAHLLLKTGLGIGKMLDENGLIKHGMYAGLKLDTSKKLPPIPEKLEDAKTVIELELFYMEQERLWTLRQENQESSTMEQAKTLKRST